MKTLKESILDNNLNIQDVPMDFPGAEELAQLLSSVDDYTRYKYDPVNEKHIRISEEEFRKFEKWIKKYSTRTKDKNSIGLFCRQRRISNRHNIMPTDYEMEYVDPQTKTRRQVSIEFYVSSYAENHAKIAAEDQWGKRISSNGYYLPKGAAQLIDLFIMSK